MRGRASAPSQLRRKSRRVAAPRAEWLEPRQLLAIFTVTTANDAGAGSLREAIQQANQSQESDTIRFNITPSGPKSVALQSALPAITGAVTIDGTSQPGYDPANPKPMIELVGTAAGTTASGLVFQETAGAGASGVGSTVRGLAIGGFGGDGIVLDGNGHVIEGNYIGLDITGAVLRENRGVGIELESSSRNTIGGSTAASRNVISGNNQHGIRLNALRPNDATANRIIGNYIGTDATGTLAIANGGNGVDFFGGGFNTVGGRSAGERNVISGNNRLGVNFFGGSSSENTVIGNYIGTTADGTQALGNGSGGIFGLGNANTIGGTALADRNVISGNEGPGVSFQGGTTRNGQPLPNLVRGNYIGTDASGQGALGNVEAGVRLFTGDAIIGGTTPGAGNRIANTRSDVFGRAAGVAMVLSSSNNAILSNEIFANGGLGIDFNHDGVVLPNDPLDADGSGLSNQGQNHPVIEQVETGGGVTNVRGTLNSTPNTRFRLQFFGNNQIDPSGFGEGQTYIGEVFVTTDAEGNAPFLANLPVQLSSSQFVSATATDPANNTSEFSRSIQSVLLPAADLAVSTSMTPSTATVGQDLTVSVTVTNAGPAGSTGVVVTDRLPVGATFVSSPDGFQAGPDGTVVANLGAVAPGQSRTVRYVIRPTIVGTIANDVSALADQIDPTPSNDRAQSEATIEPAPGQSVLVFASDSFNIAESSGSVRITVSRTNGLGPATVRYATEGGSATAGVDYTAVSGVLSFLEGEVTKSFDIPILDDFEIEGDETIGIVLSEPGGNAVLGQPFRSSVSLLDDDPTAPPSGQFRLGASTFTASESQPFITIPVERVGGFEGEARVRLRTIAGSAAPGTDFVPRDFELVFSAGDATPKLVQVLLVNDSVFRPDRSFNVVLSDPINAPLGGPSSATVTVTDDEAPPAPPQQQRFRFGQSSYAASEDSRVAQVVIQRDSGVGAASVVFQAAEGTAPANQRFVPFTSTIQFADGETSKVVEISLIDTDQAEGNQTVRLILSSPGGGPQLGDPSTATLTIEDDEQGGPAQRPGTVRFVQQLTTVDESVGEALITLERVGGSDGRVTLLVIPSAGNARPGVDYVADPISVVFEAGETRVTIALPILDNDARDGDRAVGLFMTPPTGGASLDALTSSVLVIADDDTAPLDPTPPVVTDVQFVGPAGRPIGLALAFSEPIDPSRAVDPRAYSIVASGRDGVFGTPDDRALEIADLSYDPSTGVVALVTSSPMAIGQSYRLAVDGVTGLAITDLGGNPLDGDRDGEAGGYFQAELSRGATQRYRDADGDLVTLRLQGAGGLLDVIRAPGADAAVVRVVTTTPGRKLLSGGVQRLSRAGDGVTAIGRIEGLDEFGEVNVRLNAPRFLVGSLAASAVDSVLADGPSVSLLRSARGRRG